MGLKKQNKAKKRERERRNERKKLQLYYAKAFSTNILTSSSLRKVMTKRDLRKVNHADKKTITH